MRAYACVCLQEHAYISASVCACAHVCMCFTRVFVWTHSWVRAPAHKSGCLRACVSVCDCKRSQGSCACACISVRVWARERMRASVFPRVRIISDFRWLGKNKNVINFVTNKEKLRLYSVYKLHTQALY